MGYELTDAEILGLCCLMDLWILKSYRNSALTFGKRISIAQDTKTASIKDAECQARIEEIFKDIERLKLCPLNHREYVDHYDEKGNEILIHDEFCPACKWQAFKNKYLKENHK